MIRQLAMVWLALALQPRGRDVIERGQEAFRAKDWPAAETRFQEAVRQFPANADAHKWLGMTYAAEQKLAMAEEPFRRACELAPKDAAACYYHARTLFHLGRFEESLRAYDRVRPKDGRALLGVALVLEALDRFKQAESLFRQAIAAGEQQARGDYERFRRRRAAPVLDAPDFQFEPAQLPVIVRNGAEGKKHLVETMIAGVAVFDYDNDGWPDIFVANGAAIPSLRKPDASFHNALLRNNHDGSFTNVTTKAGLTGEGYAMGVAAADYDNDGNVDLFVAGVRRQTLYRNRGDGTFEDVTARAGLKEDRYWSVAAAWLDYDNDGRLDLFVVRYVDWDPEREPYCGAQAYRQYCHPGLYAAQPNALYRNLGNGRLSDVSAGSGIALWKGKGMGVAVGDYDKDGWMDVFVANDTEPNFLFRNQGNGRFQEVALAAGVAYNENAAAISSMGAEFRDLDNDGFEDLFVTALTNETFPLFRNTGKAQFIDITVPSGIARASLPWTGWSSAAIDLNNDGWKDLVTANGHVMDNAELSSGRQSRQPSQVYFNRQGRFAAARLPGEAFHRGLAFGDLDRDGRLDFVITRLNQPAVVLYNRNQAGNWISFHLRGSRSNRDGIGALIHIETELGSQYNRAVTSNGYACSSAVPVHFGLGTATKVRVAEIQWPSGIRQKLENLEAGRVHPVVEP
ncbi:MAG: VCBS repeat-containing protein [Acidobacteria bacterium]|nr:VCBS repeat-containing protein [Acidobacteriota bacterium]